jgi:predicted LPLAT superfamily acyltransferase
MPGEATTKSPDTQEVPREGGGLHGAFLTRFLLGWMRILPCWVCVALACPIAFVIYHLAHPQRRGIIANLEALRPEDGPLLHWWGGYRVFLQFALTYLDRLWHIHFGHEVKWEADGEENFHRLRDEPGGALVFTIHAGNYDLGSALFASKLERPLHTVRTPEQTQSLQALRKKEFANQKQAHPNLHVHYNESYSHLGLELCNLLSHGELVGIQGDRVVMDVSPMNARIGHLQFRLPRGPLVLAEMTRVPCYSVFLHRTGLLSYRAQIGAPFVLGGELLKVDQLAQRWLTVMNAFLVDHWDQWFVFEHLVTRVG